MASYDLACSGFSAVMYNVGRLPHLRDDKRGTAQPGKSSFFGGRREQGDTPLQSVARKIAEEIGITIPPEHFQYLVRLTYLTRRISQCLKRRVFPLRAA
ncbi:NUDIX domain-containing protein [Bradyrhizobium sp. F1.13.3]|uniref:NUDIX domain-containing protein n=1 Tax=Bradyrhizobium sp. F1.13.3 TaxID=3156351 RepID=UPI003399CFD2